jgi:peptidoglycan/LPS O-acetylase OafA/YrhL
MIKRLLYLNGLAIITVILYHASAWGFISMFYRADRYRPVSVPNFDMLGDLAYYGLRTIEQLIIYGIPTFMFVSGFFIAISPVDPKKLYPGDWFTNGSRIWRFPSCSGR